MSAINRIKSKIIKDPKTKCWIFQGASTRKGKFGYGQIQIKGKKTLVHRYTYWRYRLKSKGITWKRFDKLYKDLEVCHICDNTKCCNPKHLFPGTHQENMTDMCNKDRTNPVKGTKCHSNKLTELQVLKIYRMKGTLQNIANKFNIDQSMVHRIKIRKAWAWLTDGLTVVKENHLRKLTKKKVIKIYRMKGSYSKIAKRFNTSPTQVYYIKNKITWKEVTSSL